MISLSWPSICVLRTLFRLFDAMIVSRMISWLYFLMHSLAFFLMVLHISAYSIRCLLSPFPAISHRFFITAHVGEVILDLCGLLIAVATLDALCWIMSVMVSLMVSMSSSSCNVSNRFLNSSWNSITFDPIRMASTLGGLLIIILFLSTCTSGLMLHITSLWSLPMLT
ncbi:hypothetical protein NP493_1143g00056 [Ridgeia piscesae]|uniref:Uncharacterized protein n=1 Tax=Ridgeia piscesae TaxID=27915 RepID=A0AAD9NKR6_RIDPI|nr:hypothetical protein NP493_1143g00056 [Ridgeia piscesae]